MANQTRSFMRPAVVTLIIVVIGALGYVVGTGKIKGGEKPYQAVFLTNGQVYFGKVDKRTASQTVLRDVYYLQVQQPIQPTDPAKQASQDGQTQIQLVKLGGELHKPRDEMFINNDHILFVEAIENDGQVVKTIERHKRGEQDASLQSQPQTQPAQ